MAETLVSPGVLQRENDRSFVASAPVEVGAALVGPTVTGPVEIPTIVTSFGDYREKFGTTFLSGSNQYEFLTSISAQKYFAEGGRSLLVTRVTPGTFASATSTRVLANSGSATGTQSTASLNFTSNLPDNNEGLRITNTTGEISFVAYSGSSNLYAAGTNGIDFVRYTGADLTNLVTTINASSSLIGLTASVTSDTLFLSSSTVGATINGFNIQTGSVSDLLTAVVGVGGLDTVATFGGGASTTTAINDNTNISLHDALPIFLNLIVLGI